MADWPPATTPWVRALVHASATSCAGSCCAPTASSACCLGRRPDDLDGLVWDACGAIRRGRWVAGRRRGPAVVYASPSARAAAARPRRGRPRCAGGRRRALRRGAASGRPPTTHRRSSCLDRPLARRGASTRCRALLQDALDAVAGSLDDCELVLLYAEQLAARDRSPAHTVAARCSTGGRSTCARRSAGSGSGCAPGALTDARYRCLLALPLLRCRRRRRGASPAWLPAATTGDVSGARAATPPPRPRLRRPAGPTAAVSRWCR